MKMEIKKKAGVAILISDKIASKTKVIMRQRQTQQFHFWIFI